MYRTVFLSDIHLGTDICQHEKLLKFLKSFACEDKQSYNLRKLYLVGDFIDMIEMDHGLFWATHRTVIRNLLRMADKGVEIVYIPGNHDYFVRREIKKDDSIAESLNGIAIKLQDIHVTADGKRMLVLHGDEFDGVVKRMPWLYWLGDNAYSVALFINKWYNRGRMLFGMRYWSLSQWLKLKVKNAVKFIGNYERLIVEEAKQRGVEGVICGHIHKAELKKIGDIVYANCGCWTESCSAIVEHDDGHLELLMLSEQSNLEEPAKNNTPQQIAAAKCLGTPSTSSAKSDAS
jgi:UDP-2,3-diacylglucosamine pyrophosphatase LpxH